MLPSLERGGYGIPHGGSRMAEISWTSSFSDFCFPISSVDKKGPDLSHRERSMNGLKIKHLTNCAGLGGMNLPSVGSPKAGPTARAGLEVLGLAQGPLLGCFVFVFVF